MANYDLAKAAAAHVLVSNHITQPPVRVRELARLYVSDIEETLFASPHDDISGYIDLHRKVIVLNHEDGRRRQRFTIAHELGHWLLHRDQLRINPNIGVMMRRPIGGESDPFEQEANCFAANLLVPDNMLTALVASPNMSGEVIQTRISKMFDVSVAMAGYRWDSYLKEHPEAG